MSIWLQRRILLRYFVIKKGLDANDKIILKGVRQVKVGEKVEYEFRPLEEALANQKNHAK